jgi:hypothetical protein
LVAGLIAPGNHSLLFDTGLLNQQLTKPVGKSVNPDNSIPTRHDGIG